MRINNMPEGAEFHPFIVVRIVDGEMWFYGAYDTCAKAVAVSVEVDGVIMYNLKNF